METEGSMRLRMRGMMGIIMKVLMYRFLGAWAYLIGGWSTRDVFIIPALAAKAGSQFNLPGVMI